MKRTALVALLALFAGLAQAQQSPGLRGGGAVSFGDFDWDDERNLIDDNAVGFKGYAQYRFNDWFGVEGAYYNTNEFEDSILNSTDPNAPDGDYELGFKGFSGSLIGFLPLLSDDLNFFGKLGYYDFDTELTVDGQVNSSGTEDGLQLGAGFVMAVSERLGIRAELDWFDADVGDLMLVNVGAEYLFGGEKKAEPVVAAAAPPPPPPPPPPAPAPDADGDGVPDAADRCPNTPAGDRVDARGCSCDVTRQLQFAFGSAKLTEADKVMLDEVAGNLIALGFVSGTIEGHTDSVGSEAFNQRLSEQRAEAVADYLGNRGIARGRLRVVGFGLSQPVADNATEEGRAENRRVVMRRDDCGPAGGSADEDSGEDN